MAANDDGLAVVQEAWALPGTLPLALAAQVVNADEERVVVRTTGTEFCRQPGSDQWVGEILELLAGLAAGLLTNEPGARSHSAGMSANSSAPSSNAGPEGRSSC